MGANRSLTFLCREQSRNLKLIETTTLMGVSDEIKIGIATLTTAALFTTDSEGGRESGHHAGDAPGALAEAPPHRPPRRHSEGHEPVHGPRHDAEQQVPARVRCLYKAQLLRALWRKGEKLQELQVVGMTCRCCDVGFERKIVDPSPSER